jgi:hypothetical protein
MLELPAEQGLELLKVFLIAFLHQKVKELIQWSGKIQEQEIYSLLKNI